MSTAIRLFNPDDAVPGLTMSDTYRELVPHLGGLSRRSLVEHRTALAHWVAATGDPPLKMIESSRSIRELLDYLVGKGLSAATINKTWRTLRSFLRFAVRRLHEIPEVPELSYKASSRLVSEPVPMQRETISHAEIETLYRNCLQASYPKIPAADRALLWRTFLVMAWTYGMRTHDLVRMQRSAILWNAGLVRWVADKTNKLQGLPITEPVRWHLKQWLEVAGPGDRLFEPLKRAGHRNSKTGRWSIGYYSTWRAEIAVDCDPPIQLKNFRQTMVTEMNSIEPGSGAWCAGHSPLDVTGRHYDQPTRRIRDAFVARPVPPCFLWGLNDVKGSPLSDR